MKGYHILTGISLKCMGNHISMKTK